MRTKAYNNYYLFEQSIEFTTSLIIVKGEKIISNITWVIVKSAITIEIVHNMLDRLFDPFQWDLKEHCPDPRAHTQKSSFAHHLIDVNHGMS